MRIYLPATSDDLLRETGLSPRWAHAVTPGLRAALPEEDEEGLEMVATLAAADDSVRLLAGQSGAARRRLVVAADIADRNLNPGPPEEDRLPSAVRLTVAVPWTDVVALLADDAGAEPEVRAAAEGDQAALDRAAERDLLWYDTAERSALREELGV